MPVVLRNYAEDGESYRTHHRTDNECEEFVAVHARKSSTNSTGVHWPVATAITPVVGSKSLQLKPPRRKNSVGCLNAFYSSTENEQSPPYCYSIR